MQNYKVWWNCWAKVSIFVSGCVCVRVCMRACLRHSACVLATQRVRACDTARVRVCMRVCACARARARVCMCVCVCVCVCVFWLWREMSSIWKFCYCRILKSVFLVLFDSIISASVDFSSSVACCSCLSRSLGRWVSITKAWREGFWAPDNVWFTEQFRTTRYCWQRLLALIFNEGGAPTNKQLMTVYFMDM